METEKLRRLPERTLRDFRETGLMGLLKPAMFGGPEVRIVAAMEVTFELARGDGSAAWVWVILACHDALAAFFPEEAQREFWTDPDALMASSFAPSGKAELVDGGYLQVLRDGRPGHRHGSSERASRTWLFDQQLEDRALGRIAERRPAFQVSHR